MTDSFKPEDEDNNVVPFAPRKTPPPPERNVPPMFNIPPTTKYLAGIMLGVHTLFWGLEVTLIPNITEYKAIFGGFISSSWTGETPFWWWTPVTPLTSIFLHGGWMHLGVNLVMLVAIGSGAEKWLGRKRYLALFFLSSLIALLTHLAFSPFSTLPVVGASGGISGLFGAILLAMHSGTSTISRSMIPVILIWIGISALSGFMGAPDGSGVAWTAHIGGFLGGIGIASAMLRKSGR